jgi:cyanophycinase
MPDMRRCLGILVLLLVPVCAVAQGAVVVVGGGTTSPEIVARTLELAGGKGVAIVAVLPQSSAEPDAGVASVGMWLEAGAKEAVNVSFTDRAAARAALDRATLLWMPGGDQNRFMKAIEGTGLDDVIRARHAAGAVIGGTSAGAAVLADEMFTGDADLKSLTAGSTVTARGLGIVPGLLIDQHFLTRQRDNRLISAVFDHPALVGVGIDESTAVIVRGNGFDVIGRSVVVIVDARHASIDKAAAGRPISGTGVMLAVLHAGQSYSLQGR